MRRMSSPQPSPKRSPLLRDLWRDRHARRLFAALAGGKIIGALLLLAVVWLFRDGWNHSAHADDAAAVVHSECVNPLNTVWTLVAAFLVFFMQAGFMLLEAGFARTRETVNVLLEGIVDTCLCGVLFWAFGFAFMFGAGNGFIGHQYFFLQNAPDTYGSHGGPDPGVLAFPVRLRRHVQHR